MVEATYTYRDRNGKVLFYIDRLSGKRFRGRREGNGATAFEVPKEMRVLYNLQHVDTAIQSGDVVHLCEGEKDADAMKQHGLIATTNPFGAKNWQDSYSEALRGAMVVAYVDKDEAGESRAKSLQKALSGVCKSLEFRQAKVGKDPFDHLAAGYGVDEFTPYEPVRTGFMSMLDFMQQEIPPVEWIVDELIGVGTLAILVAKPKVGKSTLCEELLYGVTTGSDFLGRSVKKGRSLYMALEASPAHLKHALQASGIPHDSPIFIVTSIKDCPNVDDLRAAIEAHKPNLIIIDTLVRFVSVQDLNDYAEVTKKLTPLAEFCRETGVTILLTHHSRKGAADDAGDSALGSTAIFGMVDTLLRMRIESDKSRCIESQIRYGRDIEPTKLSFDPVTRRMSLGESVKESKDEKVVQKILELLETGPKTNEELRVQVKSSNWHSVLKKLIADRRVERTGDGRPGSPFYYALTQNSPLLLSSSIKGSESVKVKKCDKNVLDITHGTMANGGRQGTLDEMFS